MFRLKIIPDSDINVLARVINALINDRLFIPVNYEGSSAWQLRSVIEAKKYGGLNKEQALVYGIIDDSGQEGIWLRNLKSKSGSNETVLKQIIKHLETKRLITDTKSVQFPTRKMYIKASLQPSDSMSGGVWYHEGSLDTSFIEGISQALYSYIHGKTFYFSSYKARKPSQVKRKATAGKSAAELHAMRAEALEPQVKLEDAPEEDMIQIRHDAMLPFPAGYQKYPTLTECTRHIHASRIATIPLVEENIQELLNVLIWDDKIEAITTNPARVMYRAIRKSAREMDIEGDQGGPSNGLTQVPCGACPVFDICEEGGPVAPSNCEYFKRWLDPEAY